MQRKLQEIGAFRPTALVLYEHMFRTVTSRVAERMSDLIDDMLLGDYDYVVDGEHVYADVDYNRKCASERPALGVAQRRGGTVPPVEPVCATPVRTVPACGSAATAAGRRRLGS